MTLAARQFQILRSLEKRVAASTQNQALSALIFLYRAVLRLDLEWMKNLDRAKKPAPRLPVVMTESEVGRVLEYLDGQPALRRRVAVDGMCPAAGQRRRLAGSFPTWDS